MSSTESNIFDRKNRYINIRKLPQTQMYIKEEDLGFEVYEFKILINLSLEFKLIIYM